MTKAMKNSMSMKNSMRKVRKNRSGLVLAGFAGLALICGAADTSEAQTPQAQRRVKRMSREELSARGNLAVLEDQMKYPPESRPIDTSYWDLLHPWNVDTKMHPMINEQARRQAISQMALLQRSGLTAEDAAIHIQLPTSSLMYQFEMNKTILAGTQDELQARLAVTPTQSSDSNLRIHVSKAEMIGSYEFGSPNLGAVPFSCETSGTACTLTWRAPSEDKQYWGTLSLQVTLAVEGAPDDFVIRESFYSSPMVAGRFTGKFGERLENGSLVIDAGVEVQKRMACFVTANLYSADNAIPLQHAQRRVLVDPSMKTISFTFFGKIFRDYGDEGGFRVQDLKAQCKNLAYPPEWFMDEGAHQADLQKLAKSTPAAPEPTNIYFAYSTHAYATHSYRNSAFSDAEWQSPDKTRRLAMYKKSAAEMNDPAIAARQQQLLQRMIQQRDSAKSNQK